MRTTGTHICHSAFLIVSNPTCNVALRWPVEKAGVLHLGTAYKPDPQCKEPEGTLLAAVPH